MSGYDNEIEDRINQRRAERKREERDRQLRLQAKELQVMDKKNASTLFYADMFISQNYLVDLNTRPVAKRNPAKKKNIAVFHVTSLVFDKKENVNDKLINIYSAIHNIHSSLALIIKSNGKEVNFYLAIADDHNSRELAKNMLENGFIGNFPGSKLAEAPKSKSGSFGYEVLESIDKSDNQLSIGNSKNITSVSVIPALRDEDKNSYVQGLEKFIDSMGKSSYTAIILAEPVDKVTIEKIKKGYEKLYTSIAPYKNISVAYGSNMTYTLSKNISNSFSEGVTDGVSDTNSTSETTSKSSGTNSSSSWGMNSQDMSFNSSSGSFDSTSYSTGTSVSHGVNHSSTTTTGFTEGSGESESSGNSVTVTINNENKIVMDMLDKIDKNIERVTYCEAYGLWNTAAYFIADDLQVSIAAASTYKALMAGEKSALENAYINIWPKEKAMEILNYIKNLEHPNFTIDFKGGGDVNLAKQVVTPSNMVSGQELPIILGLPRKSVSGLSILNIAEFGRNVKKVKPGHRSINIGNIYHMRKEDTSAKVELDLESLSSHCFVTGSTGSGKSNTTYRIIQQVLEQDVKFMVVEPAKGEYKKAFGKVANVYGTNPKIGPMLKINPFSFPEEIHVLEHLDRLIEIFNACWPLYAAMPAILKDAMEQIYIDKGWDMVNSINISGEDVFPTFKDLLEVLPRIINSSSYSSDSKGDYIGALVTRVKSLVTGISGQIFCGNSIVEDYELFDENVIVDLSRVGSMETKSLIMGLLVLKLNEYRMATAYGENVNLKHLTILEEAHNLLKRIEGGDGLAKKSVEMICNSIAEMRTYGEGFVIVDQSPNAVDIAAIKNTNTKIVMRLPEKHDRDDVGKAAALNDEQIEELTKLEMGVAAIYQNNWDEPILAKIAYADLTDYYQEITPFDNAIMLKQVKGEVVAEMYKQLQSNELRYGPFRMILAKYRQLPAIQRREMENKLKAFISKYENSKHLDPSQRGSFYVDFIGCHDLFRMNKLLTAEPNDDLFFSNYRIWLREKQARIHSYINIDDENLVREINNCIGIEMSFRQKDMGDGVLYDAIERMRRIVGK